MDHEPLGGVRVIRTPGGRLVAEAHKEDCKCLAAWGKRTAAAATLRGQPSGEGQDSTQSGLRPLVHVGCSTWFRLAKRKKSRLVVHEVRRARGIDGIGPKVNSHRQGTERLSTLHLRRSPPSCAGIRRRGCWRVVRHDVPFRWPAAQASIHSKSR